MHIVAAPVHFTHASLILSVSSVMPQIMRGFEMPTPEEFPRLTRWAAAAASRKSVMDAIQPPEEDRSYVEQLVDSTQKMLDRMRAA